MMCKVLFTLFEEVTRETGFNKQNQCPVKLVKKANKLTLSGMFCKGYIIYGLIKAGRWYIIHVTYKI